MYDNDNQVPQHPWILDPMRFCVQVERGHPGGSSVSGQFFEESTLTGSHTWIGKCGAYALLPTADLNRRLPRYREELLEILGVKMYSLLGIDTPETGLCPQPVQDSVRDMFSDYRLGSKCFLHVFSRFVEGFHEYGQDFTAQYRTQAAAGVSFFSVKTQEGPIPLRGFGAVLAAADFLHDTDCIGNSGANIGWVLRYDEHQKPYAHTIKIDPGAAFNFLPGSMLHNADETGNRQTLSGHDAAARDLWIGPNAGRLHYEDLMLDDQHEFVEKARFIITITPQALRAIAELACMPEGLTPQIVNALITGLTSRQHRLIAAFAPEVHAEIAIQAAQQRAQRVQLQGEASSKVPLHLQRAQAAALKLKELGTGKCWLFQLPPPLSYFVSREEPLLQITLALQQSKEGLVCQGIYGLGGMGKTQLALHYAYSQQDFYQRILWIYAEIGIDDQTRELGRALCGIEDDVPLPVLMQHIYQKIANERVLIVFDNVDDPASLAAFIPPQEEVRSCHVITTHRLAEVLTVPAFHLEGFTSEEGMLCIHQCLGKQFSINIDEASQLLNAIENHPLALAQALAYISRGHCTLAEYPKHFYLHQLRSHLSMDEPTLDTVRTSLMLSLLQLREQQPQALVLLQNCFGFAAENIPMVLLADVQRTDVGSIAPLTLILSHYSLLQVNLVAHTVSIHRLLLRILGENWENVTACEAHLKRVAEVLTGRLQYDSHRQDELSFAKRITIHATHLIEMLPLSLRLEQANLSRQLGSHYQYTGEYRAFQWCLERALLLHEKHYGKDHPEVAITLYSLSNAYEALGDIEAKKQRLERALVIHERHYGKDHIETASMIGSLGNAYGALGDNVKKKALLERAIVILEHYYGKEHVEVATMLTNLGGACDALGNPAEAKKYLKRALVIQEHEYGKNDPRTAITLGNLATAYGSLGDVLGKKTLLERALLIKEHHYGKEHSAVATTLDGLGSVYISLGDNLQSKVLLERALRIKESAYGEEHPMVAYTLNLLGIVYGNSGEIMRSKELLERALHIQEGHYGKSHPEVATTLVNLGNAYGALNNSAREKTILERVLTIQESHYGKDHPIVAATLANLGCAHGALGNISRKKELLERALVIEERHYGKDHYEVAMTLSNLGDVCHLLGEGARSKMLLERALFIQEHHYGKNHSNVAKTLFHLGKVELALNHPVIALEYARRCLAIFQYIGDFALVLDANNLIMQCNLVMKYASPLEMNADFIDSSSRLNQKRKALQERYGISPGDISSPAHEKLFRCAAAEGELEILTDCHQNQGVCVDNQDTNPRNQRTALHWACVKQHAPIIEYLLKHGACFSLLDAHGKMAWEYLLNTSLLILFKNSAEALLKKYAIKTSVLSVDWGKLLRMAVVNHCLADVRYCIEVLSIDINSADDNPASRRTPLHWACLKNDPVIASYLYSQGAQVGLLDAHAKTALNYATEAGQKELVAALERLPFPVATPSPSKKASM